jgi:hypothetical protein
MATRRAYERFGYDLPGEPVDAQAALFGHDGSDLP